MYLCPYSAAEAHVLNAVSDQHSVPAWNTRSPAGVANEPHADLAAIEADAIASAGVPANPESFRTNPPEDLTRRRSPRAFIDSESEEVSPMQLSVVLP